MAGFTLGRVFVPAMFLAGVKINNRRDTDVRQEWDDDSLSLSLPLS